MYSGLQVVLGPGDSLREDKGSGSCSCITRFHSYSLLCAASFTGEPAVRAGILFHRESEVLGTESLLPITPHLILGGSIISMAGGLEWRDGIRVDTEAWCLASIQLQSVEIILRPRTLWDAPRPELRRHFCLNVSHVSSDFIQILVSITDVNISSTITHMKISGSRICTKKNGEVKEILNSNKREWFLAVFSVRQDKRVCFSVSRYLLSFFFAFSRKEILDSNTWTIDVEYLWQPLHSETQFLRALLSLPRGADLYSKVDSTNSGKTRPTPRTSSNDLVWFYELAE